MPSDTGGGSPDGGMLDEDALAVCGGRELLEDLTFEIRRSGARGRYAADQDLPCLAELGMVPSHLYDTELAARLAACGRSPTPR